MRCGRAGACGEGRLRLLFRHLSSRTLSPVRPLRLFARPEPIDAIAQVPDGPPAQFTWRHVKHQVVRAEGPGAHRNELVARRSRQPSSRGITSASRIASGARMWLYREGLYDREVMPPQVPRWYLHGLFA